MSEAVANGYAGTRGYGRKYGHQDTSMESEEARKLREFNKMLKASTEIFQDKKRALDKRVGRKLGGGYKR